MICIAGRCQNQIWAHTRRETDDAAIAAGWRFQWDGKGPLLSTGAAICPTCVAAGQEKNFEPAKKARSK